MTTAATETGPHLQARSEFQEMILHLDERASAIELSWHYTRRLGRDDWLALRDIAERNELPLHIT